MEEIWSNELISSIITIITEGGQLTTCQAWLSVMFTTGGVLGESGEE